MPVNMVLVTRMMRWLATLPAAFKFTVPGTSPSAAWLFEVVSPEFNVGTPSEVGSREYQPLHQAPSG